MAKSKRVTYGSYSSKAFGKSKRQSENVVAAAEPVAGLHPMVYSGVFTAAIFVSATLLFMVQPMVAKMMLPLLGGAPAVWTTCMVFFQAMLLGGYLYAHVVGSRLSLKAQTAVHGSMLIASALCLPIGLKGAQLISGDGSRIIVVLTMLAVTVGLPFFTMSASAPLLQKWFSRTGHRSAKDPYFMYAASNVGSMLSLFAYPTIIEPNIGLLNQSRVWTAGYLLLAASFAVCGYLVLRASKVAESIEANETASDEDDAPAPTIRTKAYWVALAFVPSSLMLGVTTFFTTDVATVPLLWIMPLALYLLTFIIVFAKMPENFHRLSAKAMPIAVLLLFCHIFSGKMLPITTQLLFHLVTFTLVTLVFHGEIARTRPSAKYLTEFYLLMSLGGVLGGIFNGIAAPMVFTTAAEYPMALVIACLLIPTHFLRKRKTASQYPAFDISLDVTVPLVIAGISAWMYLKWPLLSMLQGMTAEAVAWHQTLNYLVPACMVVAVMMLRRPMRMGLAIAAFVFVGVNSSRAHQNVLFQDRSFFGILKVSDDGYGTFRSLVNGTTLHGRQFLDPATRREPLTYYHKRGPVGQVFEELYRGSNRKLDYAAIGLGTGTLTSYGVPGQNITVYEIDKAVKHIATTYFHFVEESQGNVNIVLGDARLKLQEAKDKEFGVILVDAFSSDAIPVHLLTKEAVELYFQKVADRGLVAIHVSNRYLSLEPILGNIAAELRLTARVMHDNSEEAAGKTASSWVLLTRDEESLGQLATSPSWSKLEAASWLPTWTDDFTSVLTILK